MSEVVGNVSLELSIDRDKFDRQLEQLKRTKLESLKIQAQLDTTTLNKQLAAYRAVSNIRLGVTLDGRAAALQLNDLTKARSIAVTAVADTRAAAAAIDTLTQSRSVKISAVLDSSELSKSIQSLAVNQTIKISTSVDVSAAANQINQLLRPRTIAVRFEADDSGLNKPIRKPETKLRVTVDDSALTKLNEHLSLKERHFKQVQAVFDSPLTPKVDDRGLSDLNRSIDQTRAKFSEFRKDYSFLKQAIDTVSTGLSQGGSGNFELDSSSISEASAKFQLFNNQMKTLRGLSTGEISLKISHIIDSSKLENLFNKTSESFEKSGSKVGESIAAKVSKSSVAVNSGPFSSIFRGVFEAVGQKISSGFSSTANTGLAKIGQMTESYVTSKAGKMIVSTSQNLGYKNTREMRQDVSSVFSIADRFIDPSKSKRDMKSLEIQISKALTEIVVEGKSLQQALSVFTEGTGNEFSVIGRVAKRTVGGVFRQISPVLRVNKDIQIAKAAKQAEKMAEAMEISDREVQGMNQYNGLAFAIGGQHYMQGQGGEKIVKPMLQRTMPGAYVEGVSNKYRDSENTPAEGINRFIQRFNPNASIEGILKKTKLDGVVGKPMLKMLDTAVFSGATPEIIELAARTKALKNKGLNVPVSAVGYSAGGADAADYQAMMQKMGIEVSAVGLGSPLSGLANRPAKGFTSVMGTNDNIYRGMFGTKASQESAMSQMKPEQKADFQDLMTAGLLFQKAIDGATIVSGAGTAHKLSDYISDPKVQGILSQSLPGSIPATSEFTSSDRRRSGTRNLDFIDKEAAEYRMVPGGYMDSRPQKKHSVVIAAEKAMVATYPREIEQAFKELESLKQKYSAYAKKTTGGIKKEAESLVEVIDDAIESLNVTVDFGGAPSLKGRDAKDRVNKSIAKFKEANTANSLQGQQSAFFDQYDTAKYQSELKSSFENSAAVASKSAPLKTRAAGLTAKVQELGPTALSSSELEIIGLSTKVQDRFKNIEGLNKKALAQGDAVSAKTASIEIDRHTQAIQSYFQQLSEIESKIEQSKKLLSRPDRVKTRLNDTWGQDLEQGSAELMILKNNAPQSKKPAIDDPWEDEQAKAKRIADERLARKLEQSRQRREKVSRGFQRVKEAVFNPDREITVDMDQVRGGVAATGKAMYSGGLAIAKTMDAINTGFNVLAQSNPGQRVLGTTKEASTALLHVAKTSYALAKGAESAALMFIPFGGAAKGAIQNIGLPMLAANVAASHIPGGQMLLEGAGNVANMALGPLAHGGVSALAQGVGSSVGGAFPQFGGMGAQVASGISGLIEGGLGSAITPAIEGAVTLLSGKFMLNAAGAGAMRLPGVAEIAGIKAIAPSTTFQPNTRVLPQAQPRLSLAASSSQGELDAVRSQTLNDLTDKQLRAYAKTQGLHFGRKAKKDDVVARLEGTTGDREGMVTQIQSQFDRKGRAIGIDSKAESSMLAKLKQKENELNQLHILARKSQGQKRAEIVSQLLHETDVFTRELNDLNRTPMSGPTSQKVGQTLGRIESKYRHAPENAEAKRNNSATIKGALNGPLYGQTIDAQSERLARVSGLGFPNVFGMVRTAFQKATGSNQDRMPIDQNLVQDRFKSIYGTIAKSNKYKGGKIPTLITDNAMLESLGVEALYDAQKNAIIVRDSIAGLLSTSRKSLSKYARKLKPLIHEIQHSQQLDGGNLTIEQAALNESIRINDRPRNPLVRMQAARSASVAVAENPNVNRAAAERLEIDAYNKESRTREILEQSQRRQGLIGLGSNVKVQSSEFIQNRLIKDTKRLQSNLGLAVPGLELQKAEYEEDGQQGKANRIATGLKRFKGISSALNDVVDKQDKTPADIKRIELLRNQLLQTYEILDRKPSNNFAESLSRVGGAISGKIQAIKLLTGALLTIPFAGAAISFLNQFAKNSIQASIAADRMKTSLQFSTGSKAGAEAAFNKADETVKRLGIDRKSALEGNARFKAASKGKLSESQSDELFEGLAAASTTLGLSADDQNGIMLALGQVSSKGSVQSEEIRGQIGERFPGFYGLAARSMGMSEPELGKAMESGSISAEQFLPKVGAQLKREFGPGAQDASQNIQSSLFRVQGSIDRISEGAGKAAAPGMKMFVDVFVGGLDLIAKYGQQTSQVFTMLMGGALIKLGSLALATVGPMITSFLAYNGIAATIPGVLGAIGGSLSGLIPIVGVFAAKFLLINAGIEIAKTLFSAFTPSDMATRFTSQADKINKSLKEMEENGNKAKGAMPTSGSDAPSKGIDLNAATFGVAGAVGFGKGDDLVKSAKKESWFENALRYVPIIGEGIRYNEANGGKGLASMQEVITNNEKIAQSDVLGSSVFALSGKADADRGKFSKSLEIAQSEQKIIDEKQAEKNRLLSGGGNNKEAIASVDRQITESAARRDDAGKEFSTYRDTIQSQISELKNQKESIAKSEDYSADQKKELLTANSFQLSNLETVKKQMDGLDRQFNSSGDIISKFNVSMSEMAAKIEEVSAAAENSFNKSEVSRLQDKSKGRQTDEFASTNTAERQASNEYKMASQKLSGTQRAIADVDKLMSDPTVQRDLAKITVNGKSIDGETSASQLEQAKAGKSDGEKQRIEKLISRRKAIDSVPTLQKNQLEADEKKKEARSSNEIAKMDRRFENREVQFKEFEGKANVNLINAQKGNRIDKSDVDIRSAEIQGISAKEQQSVVKDKMASIKKLYDTGVISKEEYIKRSIALRGQLTEANTKAAQAELAIEQAKNAKILQDYEITVKKRELADKRIRSEALISLAKGQMGNRMSEDDVNVKKAEIDSASANRGAANIGQQIQELENLKNRGVITHEDYVKRKLDLDSNYLDAKVRQADAELALEKAKNQKIVNEFDKLQQQKAFKLEQAQGNRLNDIKEQALGGKVVGMGGEKEAREERIKTSEKKLADLAEKSRGIDKLRNVGMSSDKDLETLRAQAKYGYGGDGDSSAMDALNKERGSGAISQKEYDTRKMEVQNAYRLEKENLLNLQIAKRLALYQAEADAFKRANNDIIRGLEKQRSEYEINKTTMTAQQGVKEAELGYARAVQSNQEVKAEMIGGNPAASRISSLNIIQKIELEILNIKERQQRASLKQAEIESTISIAKQKIAINEAKKKLREAKLTGDIDAIANAQDDLTGQSQILGFEIDKKNALKEQNALAEQRLGIERKTAELGMETDRLRIRADQLRNQKASQGSVGGGSGAGNALNPNDGVNRNIDPVTGNMIIGGGNFITGEGIKPNLLGGVNPANLGTAAAAVDTASRVDPKNSTINSFEVASDKGSNKIVGAIEKLGSDIKSAPNKSESKPISGDYSGLINGLVDSSNARN